MDVVWDLLSSGVTTHVSFHLQYCYGNSPIMDPITEMGVSNPFELSQVKDPKCKNRGGGLVRLYKIILIIVFGCFNQT